VTAATNLLLTGGHAHDFAATSQAIADLLAPQGIRTQITEDLPAAFEDLHRGARYDLLTVNAVRFRMLPDRYRDLRGAYAFELDDVGKEAILGHLSRGGGLLALHTAPICFDDWPMWPEIVGAAWDWATSGHPPPLASAISFTDEPHPVTAGLEDFELVDEIYHDMAVAANVVPLATSQYQGRPQPVLWARTWRGSRVATDVLGHSRASLEHPVHGTVVARAALWALGREDASVTAYQAGGVG
jgi:type 1 glutamine amidotransferase